MGRALPFAPLRITDVHPQEKQRDLPLALPFRVRVNGGRMGVGALPVWIRVHFGMSQRPTNEKAPRGEPGGAC